MTIKEIEARCAMDRANIRFYEREELLAPDRLSNGYRDYTERDAETLLRIKLLRSLHVPLEDIRAVQTGAQTLDTVLQNQLHVLEAERESLACAEAVCRAMQTDGAEFETLDADKYLQKLGDGTPAGSPYDAAKQRDLPPPAHPWRRLFARELDLLLCAFPYKLLFSLVFHINPTTSTGRTVNIVTLVLAMATMLVLEPLLLHRFGTTPGKAVFGLHLTNKDGSHLSYTDGLRRTWSVLWRGYGLYIPVYNLVRLWKSYKTCTADEPEPWDDYPYTRLYTIRDTRPWRGAVFAAAYALCALLSGWAAEVSRLPPNRGELTVAEFAENYNYLCRYYELPVSFSLASDGSWVLPAVTRGFSGLLYTGDSPKGLLYTTENGVLTGFSVAEENVGLLDVPSADSITMLALAAVTAEPNAGAFSGAQDRVAAMLSGTPYNPAHYTWGRVTIDYTIDFTENGEPLSYRFAVTKTA
ncbi:MAG: RDD family protein [Hominenteromicrobium sp.]